MVNAREVKIEYTNYRGERGWRTVIPALIYFGSNEWHKEPQWLLHAFDITKGASRSFAMKDIHSWVSTPQKD